MSSSKRAGSKYKIGKTSEPIASSTTPLIFISHDTRDAKLAEAFSKLLSQTSTGVLKTFRSSDRKGTQGIEYGVEWFPELMRNINSASDIVCLLTRRSLDRPWLLYEAGVARGKLDTPVIGIALGIPLIQANTGPFAQFQNSDDSEESLTKLVMQLVRRIPNAEPDRETIEMQVKSFKVKAAEILEELDKDLEEDNELAEETSVPKLFEEIKIMFEDLPSRIDGNLKHRLSLGHSRIRPLSSNMFEEFMHYATDAGGAVGFLMIITLTRDDFPWLYQVGMEGFEAIKAGESERFKRLFSSFHQLIGFTLELMRGRFFLKSNNNRYEMLKALPGLLESVSYEPIFSLHKPTKRGK
jgi:hypothetical protein